MADPRVAGYAEEQPAPDESTRNALMARIAERQSAVGYHGDFEKWLEEVGKPC